eukprot:4014886-Pleurochrysis_carterae.AAC.3
MIKRVRQERQHAVCLRCTCTECDVRARPSMLMPRSDSAAASECAEALDTLAARSTSSACRTSKRTLPRCSSPASRRYTCAAPSPASRANLSEGGRECVRLRDW